MTFSTKRLLRSCTENPRRNRGSKKKGITESWDLNTPSDLLYEILSRLGLKDNIQASAVCKTWLEAAVSVRNLQPRPLLFYPQGGPDDGDYILLDPSRSAAYNISFPDLNGTSFCCSRDGWLLVSRKSFSDLIFFLDPFTRERIYLPIESSPCYSKDDCLAFSAAPTSTSCLVISLQHTRLEEHGITYSVIHTWQPGETVWTTHHLEHTLPCDCWEQYLWEKCLFSNGIFYCLSTSGRLGVYDPYRETWNTVLVERVQALFQRPVLMTEHEGDIFLVSTRFSNNNNSSVFKLNLELKVWEEKREVGGGLAVFVSYLSHKCIQDIEWVPR